MPHSSRKKKPTTAKRREITGEDGWTRVTKGISSRLQSLLLAEGSGHNETVPSKGSTIENLTTKYKSIETVWLASESCKILVALLEDRVLTEGLQIDRCVMYGSGSFCGLVREEVERRAVALCQLAVFKTLQRAIEQYTDQGPLFYAQEPSYNYLDKDFLKSQNIAVVDTPQGFELLSSKSLAYTAYTDMDVDMQVIHKKPGIFLSSRLDWYWRNARGQARTSRMSSSDNDSKTDYVNRKDEDELRDPVDENAKQERQEFDCQAFEAFLQDKEEAHVPDLDYEGEPFHNQYLYWRKRHQEGADDQPQSSTPVKSD